MAEWTPEAREYLDGYLGQVRTLTRSQGEDGDDIVEDLRAHVEREAEEASGALVTIEHLRAVLARTGAPEQIAGVLPAAGGWAGASSTRREPAPSIRPPRGTADINRPPARETPPSVSPSPAVSASAPPPNKGRRIAIKAARYIAFAVGVLVAHDILTDFVWPALFGQHEVVPGVMETDSGYVNWPPVEPPRAAAAPGEPPLAAAPREEGVYKTFNATADSALTPSEATARDVMSKIRRAQEQFCQEKRSDVDGDGVSDYATLEQLTAPTSAANAAGDTLLDVDVSSGVSGDYRFILELRPSATDGAPHYVCVAMPVESALAANRCLHLDERGIITLLGNRRDGTQPLVYRPD